MTTARLLRRPRKPAMRFMLTPLIDVIFLLLTFFMLSSSIEPYASLSLGQAGRAAAANDKPADRADVEAPPPDLVVAIAHGEVQANGDRVALADFPLAAKALRDRGAATAVVFTRSSATVQDVVTTLGALRDAAFETVTIRTRAAAS